MKDLTSTNLSSRQIVLEGKEKEKGIIIPAEAKQNFNKFSVAKVSDDVKENYGMERGHRVVIKDQAMNNFTQFETDDGNKWIIYDVGAVAAISQDKDGELKNSTEFKEEYAK